MRVERLVEHPGTADAERCPHEFQFTPVHARAVDHLQPHRRPDPTAEQVEDFLQFEPLGLDEIGAFLRRHGHDPVSHLHPSVAGCGAVGSEAGHDAVAIGVVVHGAPHATDFLLAPPLRPRSAGDILHHAIRSAGLPGDERAGGSTAERLPGEPAPGGGGQAAPHLQPVLPQRAHPCRQRPGIGGPTDAGEPLDRPVRQGERLRKRLVLQPNGLLVDLQEPAGDRLLVQAGDADGGRAGLVTGDERAGGERKENLRGVGQRHPAQPVRGPDHEVARRRVERFEVARGERPGGTGDRGDLAPRRHRGFPGPAAHPQAGEPHVAAAGEPEPAGCSAAGLGGQADVDDGRVVARIRQGDRQPAPGLIDEQEQPEPPGRQPAADRRGDRAGTGLDRGPRLLLADRQQVVDRAPRTGREQFDPVGFDPGRVVGRCRDAKRRALLPRQHDVVDQPVRVVHVAVQRRPAPGGGPAPGILPPRPGRHLAPAEGRHRATDRRSLPADLLHEPALHPDLPPRDAERDGCGIKPLERSRQRVAALQHEPPGPGRPGCGWPEADADDLVDEELQRRRERR